MTTSQRKVHRVGVYVPKERRPAPPVVDVPALPVATDEDDDEPTVHIYRPPVVLPSSGRLPPRLRKEAPVARVDIAPASPKGVAPWYGVFDNIEERIDERGFSYFVNAYNEVRERAAVDEREMLDPKDVPLEAKEVIAAVEDELADERAAMAGAFTKVRAQIAEHGMRSLRDVLYVVKNGVPEIAQTGLALVDLDTRAKAYDALLKIIPAQAFWYAVTGKRIVYPEGVSHPQPQFQDIGTLERAMYAVGSVVYLGEIFNGIRHTLARNGTLDSAKRHGMIAIAKAIFSEAAQLVAPTVARAQQHGIHQLTKKR